MFPVGDQDVRGSGLPIVTWLLIGINVVVFVYELTLGSSELQSFFQTYGVVPAQILEGQNLFSLLASMFIHGGWLHIIGNMLFLAVFGDNVEAVMGKVLYLIFYLAGGLAASALQIAVSPSSTVPNIGASGAVAAVLGAYALMFPGARVRVLLIFFFFVQITWIRALIFIGIWFVLQFLYGLASLGATAQSGGVAYWAHVGGFVPGVVAGLILRRRAQKMGLEPVRRRGRRGRLF
jgi:membrane associated rhomboid family serine protease